MASPSSIAPWTPAPGRHAFNIGPALAKALKARKLKASPGSTATAKRSNLPERDFYSFRFNFKPPSIDTTKPASIEIQKSADNTKVLAEYPSTQSGEAHIFRGTEQSAREVDCVLIYDEDTGTYSLEKLDSFVNLHYDRKTTVSPRSSIAPIAAPQATPPTEKTNKSKGKQRQAIDELELELLGLDEDAEGDIDMSVVAVPKAIVRKEVEEGEVFSPPKPSSPVPPKAQPLPPPKARPVKPIPKHRVEAKAPVAASQPRQKATPLPPSAVPTVPVPAVPAPPRQKPRPVQKKEQVEHSGPVQQTGSVPKKKPVQKTESTQKKEPIQKKEKKAKPVPVPTSIPTAPPKSASYTDEVIEFGGRPAKRPRPSTPQQPALPPTPPATVTLSLPGGSNSFAPPPLPAGSHSSRGTGSSSRNVPPPIVPPPPAVPASLSLPTSTPASPPMMGQYETDEEEDWDEVSTANLALAPSNSNSNSNVDDDAVAYELELEQDIFRDVFEEIDGDDERQVDMQPSVDGDHDGEEEEIDVTAFEQELNEHMEVAEVEDDSDDDVFGGLAVDSEPDGTRQPISMNRLASGVEMSEEEYSSSDDSDDD